MSWYLTSRRAGSILAIFSLSRARRRSFIASKRFCCPHGVALCSAGTPPSLRVFAAKAFSCTIVAVLIFWSMEGSSCSSSSSVWERKFVFNFFEDGVFGQNNFGLCVAIYLKTYTLHHIHPRSRHPRHYPSCSFHHLHVLPQLQGSVLSNFFCQTCLYV